MNIVRYLVVVAAVLIGGTGTGPVSAASPDSSAEVRTPETQETLFRRAREAEWSYRHRLARLRRLRHLAREHQDAQRLAEIEALHERLTARHQERMHDIRGHLGAEARDRLEALIQEGRDRFEHRREARQDRREHKQEVREDRREHRQDAREHRRDHRQEVREDRSEHRQDAPEHRRDHGQEVREDRREHRQDAREEAHERWAAARERAAADLDAAHRQRFAARQTASRWRDEAREHRVARRHRDDRWRDAAKREGMIPEVPPRQRHEPGFAAVPTQQEADAAAVRTITGENADAELERLRLEIGSSWGQSVISE